jgi:hypothetical protein
MIFSGVRYGDPEGRVTEHVWNSDMR